MSAAAFLVGCLCAALHAAPVASAAAASTGTPPPGPTKEDLATCQAVVDKDGHGPDPGSAEWWAACARILGRPAAPSFDCSRASGQVEKLICSDHQLAALDVELAHLYTSVSAQTTGEHLKRLRTYQRGWIKGRNDCWKAVAVSVRACVEASYRDRIRQLRAQGGGASHDSQPGGGLTTSRASTDGRSSERTHEERRA